MIQTRLNYDKKTDAHAIELHRHGEVVERLSVHEAGKLIEQLTNHICLCFYDVGGKSPKPE